MKKRVKRIICVAATIAVLIGLMPTAEKVKADETYYVNIVTDYVDENMQEVMLTNDRIPITSETTYGDVINALDTSQLVGSENREGANFIGWSEPGIGGNTFDDVIISEEVLDQMAQNPWYIPEIWYTAQYDKTFVPIEVVLEEYGDGGYNVSRDFGLFFDDDITYGDFLNVINERIEDIMPGVENLDNPRFVFWNETTNEEYWLSQTVGTLSHVGEVKLLADCEFVYVNKSIASNEFVDHTSKEGKKMLSSNRKIEVVKIENGDTNRDIMNKVSAPKAKTLKVMGASHTDEVYEFVRWISCAWGGISQAAENDLAVDQDFISVKPLWNYAWVRLALVGDTSFTNSFRYNKLMEFYNFTTYGAGQTFVNTNICIPVDESLTYKSLLKEINTSQYFSQSGNLYQLQEVINGIHSSDLDSIIIDVDDIDSCYYNLAIDISDYKNYPHNTNNNGNNTDNKGGDNGNTENGNNSGAIDTTAEDKEITEGIIEKLDELIPTASDSNKQSITVDMQRSDGSYDTTISSDILEKLQGKNVDVTFDMGGYSWTVNGKNITAENLKDINLEVNVESKSIPVTVYNKLEKAFETVGYSAIKQLSLAYDGDFGFEASLNINLGTDYFGKVGSLYFYSWDGSVQFMNSSNIDADGNAQFSFTHASDYAIVISDASAAPDTGDHSNIGLYTLLAVIAAAGITSTIIYKKKAFER